MDRNHPTDENASGGAADGWGELEESLASRTAIRLGATDAGSWRPGDDLLVRLRQDPASIDAATRKQIDTFFAANPAERDAFEAFRLIGGARVAASAPLSLGERLSAILTSLTPARGLLAAAAALSLMLFIGVGSDTDLFGVGNDAGTEVVRGDETPVASALPDHHSANAVEIALLPGDVAALRRPELAGAPLVIRLLLPDGSDADAIDIRIEGSDAVARVSSPEDGVAELALPAGFTGQLDASLGDAHYRLEVRE